MGEPRTTIAESVRLPPEAQRLLTRLEKSGSLRGVTAAARAPLERAALAHATSEHTAAGRHEATLRPLADCLPPEARTEGKRLTLEDALLRLRSAGLDV